MIIAFPISAVLGQKTGVLRYALQQFGDKRLKMVNELLAGKHYLVKLFFFHTKCLLFITLGIRIVKYYAWEEAFFNNIDKARDQELAGLRNLSNVRAVMIVLLQAVINFAMGLTIVRLVNRFYKIILTLRTLDLVRTVRAIESIYIVYCHLHLHSYSSSLHYVAVRRGHLPAIHPLVQACTTVHG